MYVDLKSISQSISQSINIRLMVSMSSWHSRNWNDTNCNK